MVDGIKRQAIGGEVVALVKVERPPSDAGQPFAPTGAEAPWEDAGGSGGGGEEEAAATGDVVEDDITDEPPRLYAWSCVKDLKWSAPGAGCADVQR